MDWLREHLTIVMGIVGLITFLVSSIAYVSVQFHRLDLALDQFAKFQMDASDKLIEHSKTLIEHTSDIRILHKENDNMANLLKHYLLPPRTPPWPYGTPPPHGPQ